MDLEPASIAYLSDALSNANITHADLNKICAKIDVDVEYTDDPTKGYSLDGRLWALIENINGSKTLNKLIQEIVIDYEGWRHLKEINRALNLSGYTVNKKGQISGYMGKQIKIGETQSKIEEDLNELGLTNVLDLLNNGIKQYGEGKVFPSIRNAIEGLVEEILNKEGISTSGSVRDRMERLQQIDVLSTEPDQLRVQGRTIHLELAHAYGIYSLLSHYLNHYSDVSEEELHFVFFQSIGLIWLITQRYMKYLQ